VRFNLPVTPSPARFFNTLYADIFNGTEKRVQGNKTTINNQKYLFIFYLLSKEFYFSKKYPLSSQTCSIKLGKK